MALVVTVNGVDRTANTRSFNLRRGINTVGTGDIVFVDRSGSTTPWIPDAMEEVVVTDGGVTQFRGRILTKRVAFVAWGRAGYVTTDCQVADNNDRAGLELLNTVAFAGKLRSILTVIMGNLSAQGVTLGASPTAVEGPDLDNQLFAWTYCRDALNHLSELSGYVWRIGDDAARTLEMWAVGSRASGTTFSQAQGNIRRLEWAQDVTGYRNVQWVVYGPTQDSVPVEETWTQTVLNNRSFPMAYQLNGGLPPNVVTRSDTGATVPCGPDTTWEWSYDQPNNRILQTGGTPLPLAATLTMGGCTVGFPQFIVRRAADIGYPNEEADPPTGKGRWMRKDTVEVLFDYMEARNAADALIRNNMPRPQRLSLTTGGASLVDPGETAVVALPELGVASADFLCTAVTARYFPAPRGEARVEYELELIGGSTRQADWVDFWRELGGSGGGGGSSISGGAAGGGSSVSSQGASYLGGAERQFVSSASQVLIPEGVAVELDSAAYPSGKVLVRCELRTNNAATTVRARLVRLDTLAEVGVSDMVSATSWTRVKFSATLVAGVQWYALYLVPSDASNPVQGRGAYLV